MSALSTHFVGLPVFIADYAAFENELNNDTAKKEAEPSSLPAKSSILAPTSPPSTEPKSVRFAEDVKVAVVCGEEGE